MQNTTVTAQQAATEILRRQQAKAHLIDFMQYVWWYPHEFIKARHTLKICKAIDQAITDYKKGICTYLSILVPFRHGKSDIVSRALPAYFLGHMQEQDPNIIMTGYGANLVEGFSKDCKKRIIGRDKYNKLFPQIAIAKGEDTIANWAVEGSTGRVTACGLSGGLTGKGAGLLIIDDCCKSRAEARSNTFRKRTWEAITNDAMTRLGPVHIVVLMNTPWHVDGVQGRVKKEMKKNPDFPRFKSLIFPARNGNGHFLFEERYPRSWYKTQYATLGKWASGLLDCDPTIEGGNRFETGEGHIIIHDNIEDFPKIRYIRPWDLASSKKERDKDDPDYTVGGLVGVKMKGNAPELWIKHATFGQWEAPKRDCVIKATAEADGPGVAIYIEAFGAYKDAFTTLRDILKGIRTVRKSRLPGDKSAKCAPLEPIFEAGGNVHLMRGDWNALFVKHFTEFPDGNHDDFCDMTAIGYHEATRSRTTIVAVP